MKTEDPDVATMVAEVYDALVEAGASEDKARKAATVLADDDREFAAIRSDLVDVRGDLKLAKWSTGLTSAMSLAILLRLFIHT